MPAHRLCLGVERRLKDGEYYEGLQMLRSIINRLGSKGQHETAANLAKEYAIKLADAKEYGLAADLGLEMINIFQTHSISPTDEHVGAIRSLGESIPPFCTSTKHRMYSQCLKWLADEANRLKEEGVDGDQQELKMWTAMVHLSAGEALVAEKSFGRAQGHLVLCCQLDSPEVLASLMSDWQDEGYTSERHLFPLRSILILLCQGEVEGASRFLDALPIDLDSPQLAAPLQAAYFLVEASKAKNLAFYDLVQTKYKLVLRRDSTFEQYLTSIETVVFGHSRDEKGFDPLGLLEGMLGNMFAGNADGC